jgi:DNA-binding NtrC family response regulator
MALILIIDDDFKIREVLRQILDRAGYEFVEAFEFNGSFHSQLL